MKTFLKNFYPAVAFSLMGLLPTYSSAQEVRTVAQCRAYREAWVTSMDTDIKNLDVKELLHRASQLVTCSREIDSKPFDTSMTHDEAINIAISHCSYAVLAAEYYQESFNRAAWYIEKKGFTKEFIADDEVGKTIKHRQEQPNKR